MGAVRMTPRDPADPRAGMFTRATGWLRENL
jgi:hypothetical protein